MSAIHLASALALGPELTALITYDRRMADAAERGRFAGRAAWHAMTRVASAGEKSS